LLLDAIHLGTLLVIIVQFLERAMSLTLNTYFDSDATGAIETLTLRPIAPASSTLIRIASVAYNGVTIPADPSGTSFTFTVLSGFNLLTVGLIAPTFSTETVQLMQGATQVATVTVNGTAGSAQIYIKGS
jgi:hypothetical protein